MGFGSGFVRGGNQVTPNQINTIPVFNVMDPLYGAKGDGVTDDTAAIQAAYTAATAAGGGIVYIPPTSEFYLISSQITVGGDTVTEGSGALSRIKLAPNVATALNMFYTDQDNVWYRDLTIDENGLNQTESVHALTWDNTQGRTPTGGVVDRVWFPNAYSFVIYVLTDGALGPMGKLDVADCTIAQAPAINWDLVTWATTGGEFHGNNISGTGTAACLQIYEAIEAATFGNRISNSGGGYCAVLASALSCTFQGNVLDLSTGVGGVALLERVQQDTGGGATPARNVVVGNTFSGNSTAIAFQRGVLSTATETIFNSNHIDTFEYAFDLIAGTGLYAANNRFNNVTTSFDHTASLSSDVFLNNSGLNLGLTVPANLLSAVDASFETGVGSWAALTNCAIAASATEALDGGQSLAITSGAAVSTSIATAAKYPVSPSTVYTIMASFLAHSTSEMVQVQVEWYTAAGIGISTVSGNNIADGTAAWVQSIGAFTSPATAAYAIVKLTVNGTPANGEIHYADCVGLFQGTAVLWQAGQSWAPSVPLALLSGLSGQLASDVTLTAATAVLVLTTASLAVGIWNLKASVTVVPSATASLTGCEMYAAVGTATATFGGQSASQAAEAVSSVLEIELDCLVTVTVAGTITITIYNNDAVAATAKASTTGTAAKAGASGYTAVRVA